MTFRLKQQLRRTRSAENPRAVARAEARHRRQRQKVEARRARRLSRIRVAPWSGCKNTRHNFGTGPQTNVVIWGGLLAMFIACSGGRRTVLALEALGATISLLLIAIPVRRMMLWRDRARGCAHCGCIACLQWLHANRGVTSNGVAKSVDDGTRRRLVRRLRVRARLTDLRVWIPRRRDDRFIVALGPIVGERLNAATAYRWVLTALDVLHDAAPYEHQMLWSQRDADLVVALGSLVGVEALVSPDQHELRILYALWREGFEDPTALKTANALTI